MGEQLCSGAGAAEGCQLLEGGREPNLRAIKNSTAASERHLGLPVLPNVLYQEKATN